MSDYEMRKKAVENYINSDKYQISSPAERKQMIRILGDERGLTEEMKKNRDNDYYYSNSEEIKKKRNLKVVCSICGLTVSKQNVKKHPNTQVCQLTSENNKLKLENENLKKIINEKNLEDNGIINLFR